MKLSPVGIEVLTGMELVVLHPYDDHDDARLTFDGRWHRPDGSDPIGSPTNGIGHVVRWGDPPWMYGPITREQAEEQLQRDVANTCSYLERHITRIPRLNANEADACILMAFNVGADGFTSSHLCAAINAGHTDIETLRPLWLAWDHVDHVENAGLRVRRAKELALFCAPMPADPLNVNEVLAQVYETSSQLIGDSTVMPAERETLPDMTPDTEHNS